MANRSLAINKDQADANYVLANLAMTGGRREQAFQGFTKVLENNPNHKDARLFRIILLYFSSYFDEALQEADQWLARDPFYPMAHWVRSTIRLHQGMFDAAVAE